MSEKTPEVQGVVTPEEQARREASTIQAIVGNIVKAERDTWMGELKKELDEFKAPDRSDVPELVNRKGETVHRLSSPTEYLYRKMPKEDREWRNPDSDHYMREWLLGVSNKDSARLMEASVRLDGMFPHERATTLEGAAGADGAISDGTGGALIPRPLEALVAIARDRVAKMRRFAGGFQMTAQTHTVPTGAATTAYMTTEAGTTTQGEPTYAEVQLTARKGAARCIVSREQLADSAVNIVGFMANRAGRALGAVEEAQFWRVGEGTPPNISAFAAGTAYTETTSAALDYTSMIGAYYTLTQEYRDGAAWYGEKSVLQALAGVRDGNGRPFYQNMLDAPLPIGDDPSAMGTIFGRPVYEVDATAGTIHFADMSALYLVGTRAGMTARTSEHVGFVTGVVQFIWEERFDGINIDTSAGQTIAGITSANSL